MERFFTMEQKQAHAQANGGWKCEGMIDRFTPCPNVIIEAHHGESFCRGGETVDENMFLLCVVCHAVMHMVAGEPWASKLIKRRMTSDQLKQYHERGY